MIFIPPAAQTEAMNSVVMNYVPIKGDSIMAPAQFTRALAGSKTVQWRVSDPSDIKKEFKFGARQATNPAISLAAPVVSTVAKPAVEQANFPVAAPALDQAA